MIILFFLFPVLGNGFVDWDDVQYVLANPALRGSWLDALGFSPGYYHPLTTLTYKLEFTLFGTQPLPYHLTSLALHLACCVSAFYLLGALGARKWSAFLAALLFGLHPVHVEPAAWVSGRKELLWGLFSLWTLISYLKFSVSGAKKHYGLSLFFFLLAALSKPFALLLPLVLLLADWYRGRAGSALLLLEKVPYLVIALPILTLSTGSSDFLFKDGGGFSAGAAALAAAGNASFYAQKLLWPSGLSALYPVSGLAGNIAGALLLLTLAAAAALLSRAKEAPAFAGPGRVTLFGLGFFLLTLLPALPVSPPADRYNYLPALGLFFIYGELIALAYGAACSAGRGPLPARGVVLAAAGHLLVLGLVAAGRIPAWKDSLALWNDVLSKYPGEHVAHYGRGNARAAAGESAGGLEDFSRCLELNPGYWKAYANRGRLRAEMKDFAGAIADYGAAIELNPGEPRLFLNRGNAYLLKGAAAAALEDYDRALAIAPQFAPALENRQRAAKALKKPA